MTNEQFYWILALGGFIYIMTKHKKSDQMSESLEHKIDTMNAVLSRFGYLLTINRIGVRVSEGKPGYDSQHNITKHGEARAADIGVTLYGTKLDGVQLHRLYEMILDMRLFSGIGIYPYWNTPGIHVDVRADRTPYFPATWSDIGTDRDADGNIIHVYRGIDGVLA